MNALNHCWLSISSFDLSFWITFVLQMHSPIITGSPIFSRQPLTPRQLYNQVYYSTRNQTYSDTVKQKYLHNVFLFVLNQPGRFMFPSSRPCPSTPQSLTPKMMQLRFGANSPRPSPFYSPSSNPVQHFRCVLKRLFGAWNICQRGLSTRYFFTTWLSCSLLTSIWNSSSA